MIFGLHLQIERSRHFKNFYVDSPSLGRRTEEVTGQALRQAVALQVPLQRGVVLVVERGPVRLASHGAVESTSC